MFKFLKITSILIIATTGNAQPVSDPWATTEACFNAKAALRACGLHHDEAFDRLSKKCDIYAKEVRFPISRVVDINQKYKETNDKICELAKEIRDSFPVTMDDVQEQRATECARVLGAAIRQDLKEVRQLRERCTDIRNAVLEPSADEAQQARLLSWTAKAEQNGWENPSSELLDQVPKLLETPISLSQTPTVSTERNQPTIINLQFRLDHAIYAGLALLALVSGAWWWRRRSAPNNQ